MDKRFKEAFAGLNGEQRKAVTALDGPVLVLAGPGTGKTQLISTRVGHILQTTDTPPEAILLLTFTEAGVDAMRERLDKLIGRPAYDIQLSTYHAFGGEIFRRYPSYFEDADLRLVEELGADSLLRQIISKLPYSNSLKFADNYVDDLKRFISDSKRALLSPDDVSIVAKDNLKFLKIATEGCRADLSKLSTISKKSVPAFRKMLSALAEIPAPNLPDNVMPLAQSAQGELEVALEFFDKNSKTTLLTEWKRYWLDRDARGNLIFSGQRLNQRLDAAAGIYRQYQKKLLEQHLYDYDDMILRAIDALETNKELKFSLAEKYSYIMLDEFQDTNPAQFKLIKLLTDHPVHEGRPNILAVGDDDQAIYAFQGADHANMAAFARHYKEVRIISLKNNYRSHPELIETGQNIAEQITGRLHKQFKGIKKELASASIDLPEPPSIEMREFTSDAAQYQWVSEEIEKLINQKIPAAEIAVLAPKHRYLVTLMPYLARKKLPVRYERRENILDEPLVRQLEQMSRLVVALAEGDEVLANSLWPEVLSYDFWKVPTERIWSISWQSRQTNEPWTAILLNDEALNHIAAFFIRLASLLPSTTIEQQLDALTGSPGITAELKLPQESPLYSYYFSKPESSENPLLFSKLISDLNILRSRLRDWRRDTNEHLGLRAFVGFIEGHRAANLNILNTSPYFETADALNLLTAYGAKGREFRIVFILASIDEVWGNASRNQGYRLALPANLSYIRYQGASEDERLRLLYVATTRARTRLYFNSYKQDLAGKPATRLKYLNIIESEKGEPEARTLPKKFRRVIEDESESISLQAAISYWTDRHLPPFKPKLIDVLQPRLKSYQLSATDLNHFINIVRFGPDDFFMKCLLYFPGAPTVNDGFGTAVHNSLSAAGRILKTEGHLPSETRLKDIFKAQLGRIDLPADELVNLEQRGQDSLKAWLKQSGPGLNSSDLYEYSFQSEGASLDRVKLKGKIDRMIIDEKRRKITVVDYKTGRPYGKWRNDVIKLHIFQHQLAIYKLLIENSARYRKYSVDKGIIEFVEPDEVGKIIRLELNYETEQVERTARIAKAVWRHIHSLEFPDVSPYPPTLAGIRQFEEDLINKNAG